MKWLYWKTIGAIDIVWHTLGGGDNAWPCRKCEAWLDRQVESSVANQDATGQ